MCVLPQQVNIRVLNPRLDSIVAWEFRVLLFFFQAEDGIRDVAVTGVQTCALPISSSYFFSLFAILPSIGQAGRKSGACLVTFARKALASSAAPFCTLNCANLTVSGERALASFAAFSNSSPAFSLSFLAKYSPASAECAAAKLGSAATARCRAASAVERSDFFAAIAAAARS